MLLSPANHLFDEAPSHDSITLNLSFSPYLQKPKLCDRLRSKRIAIRRCRQKNRARETELGDRIEQRPRRAETETHPRRRDPDRNPRRTQIVSEVFQFPRFAQRIRPLDGVVLHLDPRFGQSQSLLASVVSPADASPPRA
ncbi:hypothetical protein F2Q68_00022130 [Brassica cretica]|uniref:Uncharacterized protein n=1 Tax=Brassica cretica TaxID=69181 RepID=A0A8S9FNU9_BRACR|nr:hypothetical protein F2Q68_00022130 [Brassica cretica]